MLKNLITPIAGLICLLIFMLLLVKVTAPLQQYIHNQYVLIYARSLHEDTTGLQVTRKSNNMYRLSDGKFVLLPRIHQLVVGLLLILIFFLTAALYSYILSSAVSKIPGLHAEYFERFPNKK